MKINFVKVLYSCFCIVIYCITPACSQNVERQNFEENNPTLYIFNSALPEVKNAIFYAFDELKYHELVLCYKESAFKPIDTIGLFEQNGNIDDFYLRAKDSNFFIGKSKLYAIDSKPLDYKASFHIHLTSLDGIQTLVTVITFKPRVVLGVDDLASGPHLVKPLKYLNVPPSTIEEYEMLYEIGKVLGEKNMPTIKYPLN